MQAIADALELPIVELLPSPRAGSAAYARIIDLLGRVPAEQLAAIAEKLELQADAAALPERAQRISLVGLRGAGKSTLGRRWPTSFGVTFIELDRMVERNTAPACRCLIEMSPGLPLATSDGMNGPASNALLRRIQAAVITTAGGIVSNSLETYGFCFSHTHSVWAKELVTRGAHDAGDHRALLPADRNREARTDPSCGSFRGAPGDYV